jgi:hypothetical protein
LVNKLASCTDGGLESASLIEVRQGLGRLFVLAIPSCKKGINPIVDVRLKPDGSSSELDGRRKESVAYALIDSGAAQTSSIQDLSDPDQPAGLDLRFVC